MNDIPSSQQKRGEREILIAMDDSSRGEDALALGTILGEILDARPVIHTDAHELSITIEDTHPLLAVVGPTHRGAVGRTVVGSTAAHLVQGSRCAIAVAPAGFAQEPARHLLRIGVAFDGGRESVWALRAGAAIASRLHARLIIAIVRQPLHTAAYGNPGIPAPPPETTEGKESVFVLRRAEAILPKELPFERRILDGTPADALLAASEDLDLLILGSRAHGLAMRTLLGSVSKKVVERAGCPVLVIPRHAGPDPLGLPPLDPPVAAEAV